MSVSDLSQELARNNVVYSMYGSKIAAMNINCQMAQITKWLHAIWDYMKKVKSNISMVWSSFLF